MNVSGKRSIVRIFVVVLAVAACLCESDRTVKKKLEVILEDDLEAIVEGVAPGGVLDTPYYEIVSYKTYPEGKFTARAEVDFYFLKDVPKKIFRAYRYYRITGQWDRYRNEYRAIREKGGRSQQ